MKRKINLQTRFSFFNFLNTKNYSRITYVLGVLAATTLALSLPNCAESRKEKFLQGQGTDLQKLEELDGKEFVLNTSDAIGFSHNSVAKEVNISKEMNFQNFPLVAYSTDADLLGTVPFRGKANHQYKIRYQLNKHYLKILKIAPKTDLPFDELPYAEDLGNGEWAVPLVGYSIRGFYRIENQKNSYDRETQYLAEIPVFDPSKATHVKVDYFSHTIFDAVEKVDTYPSEVILGDWYLSVADTAISPKERMAIEGLIYAADKVRIIKRPSGYVVYNIANDENLDESQMHNLTPMFEIPAVWRDFQVKKHGSEAGLTEEEVYQRDPEAREFASIRFAEVIEDSDLEGIEFDQDYFSFTVLKGDQHAKTKFSFLRAKERHYDPRKYFKDDEKHFGFFTNLKPTLITPAIHRDRDVGNRRLLSRYNPKNDIVFHASHGTPSWMHETLKKAIDLWSQAFQKAGVGIKVKFDTSKTVALNDIRYNVLNVNNSNIQNGLFGYGPRIADPLTGEIISGTANIYLGGFRGAIAAFIRNHIEFYAQKKSKSLFIPLVDKKSLLTDLKKGELSVPTNGKFSNLNPELWVTTNHIKENCPEVSSFIERIGDTQLSESTDEELAVIESCTNSVFPIVTLPTILHEIGHVFGLRHNFKASTDLPNFMPAEVAHTQHEGRSSSIMDYFSIEDRTLYQPGLYDIAALAFGYAERVETKQSGTFVEITDTSKSLRENFGRDSLRNFEYCSDEQSFASDDLFCSKFDSGATAQEIVASQIQNIEKTFRLYSDRDDELFAAQRFYHGMISSLVNLKKAYEEWRIELGKNLPGEQIYLPRQGKKELAELINNMSRSSANGDRVKDLFIASRQAFLALKRLATLPNRYCQIKGNVTGTEDVEFISFTNLAKLANRGREEEISGCDDKIILDFLSQNNADFIEEYGYNLSNIKTAQGDASLDDLPDEFGMGPIRDLAALMMFFRGSLYQDQYAQRFGPALQQFRGRRLLTNVLDEADLRLDLTNWVLERFSKGVRFYDSEAGAMTDPIPLFSSEKANLANFYRMFYGNLQFPMDIQNSIERMKPFIVQPGKGIGDLRAAANMALPTFVDDTGMIWYVTNETSNWVMTKVLRHLVHLKEMQHALTIDEEHYEDFLSLVEEFKDIRSWTWREFRLKYTEVELMIRDLKFPSDIKRKFLGNNSPHSLTKRITDLLQAMINRGVSQGNLTAGQNYNISQFDRLIVGQVLTGPELIQFSTNFHSQLSDAPVYSLEKVDKLVESQGVDYEDGFIGEKERAVNEIDSQMDLYMIMLQTALGRMPR